MFSEDDIQQVSGITGTTREQALLLLNKFQQAEKAVNEFFDNPEKALQVEKRGWEEPPPYHDTDVPYGPAVSRPVGAPSRPPSRNDSQTNLVDLTHDSAPSGNLPGLTKEQQEEEDFQRALNNSMVDIPVGQQSGITGIGQQFGPANRSHYDKESWAMVPTSAAREVVHQPEPVDRQRQMDAPSFLRPSPTADRLPSLLTILHSIPLAREALLLKDIHAPRYGYDNQWWNGQRIAVPKVLAYGEDRDWEDVVYEVQRIMAFLDSTQRAYGSSDALASSDPYRRYLADTNLAKFFESWDQSSMLAQNRNLKSKVFSSIAMTQNESGAKISKDFYCLEPPVWETETTMYEVLDRVIWNDGTDSLDTGFDETFITRVGEIFTAQFKSTTRSKPGCGIDIPAVWYPDRYLGETKKDALDMRRRAQQQHRNVEKVERRIEQVLKHKLANGKLVDAKEALLKAADVAETIAKHKSPNGGPVELIDVDERLKDLPVSEATKCASELRAIVERIDEKVKSLEVERQKAMAVYSEVLNEFTDPSSRSASRPTHRYTLRGVATLPHVTYFRHRREVDLLVAEDTAADEWEWWRASFSQEDGIIQQQQKKASAESGETDPTVPAELTGLSSSQLLAKSEGETIGYTLERVSEEEVLKAAREESKEVLVVYASEAAINFEGSELDQHLQAFVNTDNSAFQAELKGEDVDYEMISNRSSATLAHDEYKQRIEESDMEPLIDLDKVQDQPMSPQEMGTIAYRRGEEDEHGLPSPKRSKGYEDRMSRSPTEALDVEQDPAEVVEAEKSASHHVEYAE